MREPAPYVMVVEDDADVRLTMTEALEDEGYAVEAAANGREALDILEGGARPDVILLDLMMPVMDGWEFRAAQRRVSELAAIPVIVLTAYAPTGDALRRLEGTTLLGKPLRLGDLLSALERVSSTKSPRA